MYVLLLKSLGETTTGPKDDPYVQTLSQAGFDVDLVQTLDFIYHVDALAPYQSWRDSHSAIVFTSPRGVNAFTKAGLTGRPTDLCFVVGPSTEKLAKQAGFSPKGAQCGDGESLAKFIHSNHASALTKPLLFPTGQQHRDELPHYLETNGIKVNTVIAYSSAEKDDMKEKLRLNMCEGHPIPDYVVYFSPSGVSLTETILKSEIKPHRPKVKIVAMGRSTASRLKQLDMDVSGIASSPKPDSLLTVIKQLANQIVA